MTATSGLSGSGTTLSWNGTALAELKKIGGPKFKVNTINLTNHSSPSGFSEFAAGVGDAGEITIEGNLIAGDTSVQTALIADMVAKTARAFIITGPGSLFTWTGDAIVTAVQRYPGRCRWRPC